MVAGVAAARPVPLSGVVAASVPLRCAALAVGTATPRVRAWWKARSRHPRGAVRGVGGASTRSVATTCSEDFCRVLYMRRMGYWGKG